MEHSSLHNKIVGVHWESCSHSPSFLSNLPFILQSSNQGAVDIVIIALRWSFSETLTLSQCWTLSQVYRTLATLSASNSGSSSPSVSQSAFWFVPSLHSPLSPSAKYGSSGNPGEERIKKRMRRSSWWTLLMKWGWPTRRRSNKEKLNVENCEEHIVVSRMLGRLTLNGHSERWECSLSDAVLRKEP